MWSCASDDTRSVYGHGYLDRAVDGLDKVRAFSALSPDPVTEVLVDAVISERPETRYTVGGTNRWIDIYMVCKYNRHVVDLENRTLSLRNTRDIDR